MKTTANVNIHIGADANIHGNAGNSDQGTPYAATWIGETAIYFWDKSPLEAMRDIFNKQLEDWK